MTHVEHICGMRIGVQIIDGQRCYIGVWRELECLQSITRCPRCARDLVEAERAGELADAGAQS